VREELLTPEEAGVCARVRARVRARALVRACARVFTRTPIDPM
jgi:hypothetical protein